MVIYYTDAQKLQKLECELCLVPEGDLAANSRYSKFMLLTPVPTTEFPSCTAEIFVFLNESFKIQSFLIVHIEGGQQWLVNRKLLNANYSNFLEGTF